MSNDRIELSKREAEGFLAYIRTVAPTLDLDTLRAANHLIAEACRQADRREALQYHFGQRVEFVSSRGLTIYGKIVKVNQRSLTVIEEQKGAQWKVNASAVKLASEKAS